MFNVEFNRTQDWNRIPDKNRLKIQFSKNPDSISSQTTHQKAYALRRGKRSRKKNIKTVQETEVSYLINRMLKSDKASVTADLKLSA